MAKRQNRIADLPIADAGFEPITAAELISSERTFRETDPVTTVISDWHRPRRYFEAITDARLWWIREMQLRPFEPWAKFWFQNRVTSEMIYTMVSHTYKCRHTPLQDLAHSVVSTPSTVKDYVKQAETFDLVSLARDSDDLRRVLVRLTRRSLISYENQLVLQQAMELAIRLEYGAHTESNERRGLFAEWQGIMKQRAEMLERTEEHSTIDNARALRRLNLEFDEEFYPRFVGKNVSEFTREFTT